MHEAHLRKGATVSRKRTPIRTSGPVALLAAIAVVAWTFLRPATGTGAETPYAPVDIGAFWTNRLLTLQVLSDALIFFSFLAISATILSFWFSERKKIPYGWLFVAFAAFIVACAFTHAMAIVVLFMPWYWASGYVKLATAAASLVVAFALPLAKPSIHKLFHQARSSARSERRFLAASENIRQAFFILSSVRDGAGEIVDFCVEYANAKGARLVSPTDHNVRGRSFSEFDVAYQTGYLFAVHKNVVDTGKIYEDEFQLPVPGKKTTWIHNRVIKLDDGVAITTTNISKRKEDELRFVELANYNESILENLLFATIVTDLCGTITSMNPAARTLFGYGKGEFVGRETPLVLLDRGDVTARATALTEALSETVAPDFSVLSTVPKLGLPEASEWRMVRKDRSRFDAELTVSALSGSDEKLLGFILVATDISERKRKDLLIAHAAHHDALTGLPTRTLFHDRLGVSMARATRSGRKVALLVVDLDEFKSVNDLLGHHCGDELLVHIATVLRESVRRSDTVARMGGDEFAVVLDDLRSPEEAEQIADKILRRLEVPISLVRGTIATSASVGISIFPEHGDSAATLLEKADAAMYQAKADGKHGFQTYTDHMSWESSRQKQSDAAAHFCESNGRIAFRV